MSHFLSAVYCNTQCLSVKAHALGAFARGDGFDAALAAAFSLLAALAAGALWLSRESRARRDGRAKSSGGSHLLNGQYEVREQVGEGGMGAVYKGWDRALKRPVAVKRLRAELQKNARERERFLREAELVASLRHPHIVEIYTIVRDAEDTHLVFEYIVGATVHQRLNESAGRHFSAGRALEVLKGIAKAVDHAHVRHVIHRDLKPANVMITEDGWVKVMDFGIARQVADSLMTTTKTIVGTPTYMAPEQAMGQVVKESDVYALGVTFYEMLTGGLPFKGPDEMRDKMDERYVAASSLVPDLPPAVDAVLAKALSSRPGDRYPSCLEFYRAAAEALDERVTPVPSGKERR
ncbi:MAG: serine/threonine-protein kinase [Elusimicrobiota bacterium]